MATKGLRAGITDKSGKVKVVYKFCEIYEGLQILLH